MTDQQTTTYTEREGDATVVHHPTKGSLVVPDDAWTTPGDSSIRYAQVDRDDESFHLLGSTDDHSTVLLYDQGEWDAFVAGARDGEFDPEAFDEDASVTET